MLGSDLTTTTAPGIIAAFLCWRWFELSPNPGWRPTSMPQGIRRPGKFGLVPAGKCARVQHSPQPAPSAEMAPHRSPWLAEGDVQTFREAA